MQVASTRFGTTFDADPQSLIEFPRGISGFEADTRWTLVQELGEDGQPANPALFILQAVGDPEVSLTLADPARFGLSYEFVLSDSELAELALDDPADLAVLVGLFRKENGEVGTTVSAPFLINVRARRGMQKVFLGPEARVECRPAGAK